MTLLRKMCLGFVAVVFLASLFAGWLSGTSYEVQDRERPDSVPLRGSMLGTDELGRDRFARLLYGARTSLLLAPAATLIATGIAGLIGSLAGLFRGPLRSVCFYTVDVFSGTPWLFALLLIRAVLPLDVAPQVSVGITFALLGLLGWPSGVRTISAATARINQSDFVVQARALGISQSRLVKSHIVPNLVPVLRAHFWATLPVFILAETNLSMLGLGVAEPLPSLGSLISELQNYQAAIEKPWMFAPAILLVAVLISLQLMSRTGKASHECT